jgi:hypothetical protein
MDNVYPGTEKDIKTVLTSNKSTEKKSKLFWRINIYIYIYTK